MHRPAGAPVAPAASAAAAGAIFLLVLLVYWRARHGALVWDDLSYVGNPVYRDPALWREALFSPPTGDAVFRPLTLLSFALQQWAGQAGPAPFHVASFVLHGANAALVFLIAVFALPQYFEQPGSLLMGAGLAGVAYGLHPALSESALWVAARFDLLMTFCLLAALLADRALRCAAPWRAPAVGLLFLLALLCKETAVGFLVALPLFHLALAAQDSGRGLRRALIDTLTVHRRVYLALVVALAAYLAMRFGVQGPSLGMGRVLGRAADLGGLEQRTLIAMASLTEYFTDAFWPTTEVAPNRVLGIPIVDPVRISSSLATLGGLAVVGALALRAMPLRRAVALLLAAFAAALVPVCNILPAPTYAGELQIATRYLTFPLVFAALALAVCCAGVLHRARMRKFLLPVFAGGLFTAWLGAALFVIHDTIPHWADREAFYKFAIGQAPPSSWPYLYANLGGHYLENGRHAEARDTFAFAIATQPKSAALAGILWFNLATAEAGLGNQERALSAYRIAIESDPANLMARAGIAEIERRRGNLPAAIDLLDGVLRSRSGPLPREPAGWLHYQLGLAYQQAGRLDKARTEFDAARALMRDARSLALVGQSMAQLNETAK